MSQQLDAQAGAKPLWTIGRVADAPALQTNGMYVAGKDVEVVFLDGSTEHLSLPKSDYTDARVAQLASQAAETHMRVKALAGPLVPPDLNPF